MVTCEILSQTPAVTEETHWEKAAKTRMGKYLTRLETDFISKAINPSETAMVIDVGAEAGRFSLNAADSNIAVNAIDIDAYSLRRLKLKNRNVTVLQADARKIPFKSDSLDGVIMVEVLDYIPQLDQALGECWRVLKPGSPLVLSFGNQASLKARFRGLSGKSYTHSYRKVLCCLSDTGFAVNAKLGYSWLPVGRTSQSRLVPLLAGAEKVFLLRRIPSLSPWVILRASKSI
jgi:2-polyprenyl-3-methyl-5-hydroxy-6-metoxy-1,4-benzoquinol methylase